MAAERVRAAINGYGVIGKRVADAVALMDDMAVTGVADVVADYRIHMAVEAILLFAPTARVGSRIPAGTRQSGRGRLTRAGAALCRAHCQRPGRDEREERNVGRADQALRHSA